MFLKSRFAPLYVAVLIFVLDFLSKFFTRSFIPLMDFSSPFFPYGGIGIFRDFLGIEFSISYRTNTGAAWGVFADYPEYLTVFRICMVLLIVVYLFFFNKDCSWNWPFSLVISGACGNILDFFLYGHVVDMFHFKFWGYDYPVFNIADSAISIGVFWLMLLTFWDKRETNPEGIDGS